jgi:ArsR family metal-binding transcriptional regulator
MAQLIVFPDEQSYEIGLDTLTLSGADGEELSVPKFCQGLVPSSIVLTEGVPNFVDGLRNRGAPISGTITYSPINREIPQAESPDPMWEEILGGLRLKNVRPSVTDSHRLRVEVVPAKRLDSLIPYMARLIKGGAFRPDLPGLVFEEGHRLIAICPDEIVICRVDDMLDMWIMLRTAVDLVCEAYERRFTLEPEYFPRQGVGPTEIFRRLPGRDCGECGNRTCMEFARGIITGRCLPEECLPLFDGSDPKFLASLSWLLRVIGLHNGPQDRSKKLAI